MHEEGNWHNLEWSGGGLGAIREVGRRRRTGNLCDVSPWRVLAVRDLVRFAFYRGITGRRAEDEWKPA